MPGARVQQFNRSPQTGAVTDEANADFIEVAIPFSALGGIQPGDTIKLGAVVGGSTVNLGAQIRELDTSALGYALDGSGTNRVVLEGVSVQLATGAWAPRLAILALDPDRFRLSWNAEAGRRYDVEYSSSLTNFAPLGAPGLPLTATSTNASFDLTLPASTGFLRVRVAE